MSKEQYSESMKEITGISEAEVKQMGIIPGVIANASDAGLRLLQVQFKVFSAYIEKRLKNYEKETD